MGPAAWRGQAAASAVEYAILVGLIAVVIIGAVAFLGQVVGDQYDCTASSVGALSEQEVVDC